MQTRTYKNGTTVHVVRWRANGARHFRQFVSRQEAEAFEASVRLTRANGGTPPSDPGATVADLVALYADALVRDVEAGERSRHTAATHAGQLSRHVLLREIASAPEARSAAPAAPRVAPPPQRAWAGKGIAGYLDSLR